MSIKKVTFTNRTGQHLSARLELPNYQEPHTYALFAHCFTCNKNLSAIRNISRALNQAGIAVLRFDFTGLGESEGEFENTDFSSNIQDLIAAADFLKEEYMAPSILVGHSLGGAAVIFAAKELDSVKAVATIGAPSSPAHVQHLFQSNIDEIEKTGIAKVNIGGRGFNVKKQFIDDIESKNMEEVLKTLKKPILIIHSPQDNTVEIENAKELYHLAKHPKSFISIDGADHLLSAKEDSLYVGDVIAGWVSRYLSIPEKEILKTNHQVAVSIGNDSYTSDVVSGRHQLVADEPISFGGNDYGPSPYEFVSAGLGACTVMTLRIYADRKKWDLEKVIVHINHEKESSEDAEGKITKTDIYNKKIEIYGNLDEAQRQRLLEISGKCPVHRSLKLPAIINSELIEA